MKTCVLAKLNKVIESICFMTLLYGVSYSSQIILEINIVDSGERVK